MWDIGTIVRMNEKAGQSTIRELLDKARIAFEKNDKQEFNRILEAIKAKLQFKKRKEVMIMLWDNEVEIDWWR